MTPALSFAIIVDRLIKTLSNVDGKISNMEQSLRDFSNSYSSRGIQGDDKWRIHYPKESTFNNNEEVAADIFLYKENNDTSADQKRDVTEAQKYSWGGKYESKDKPQSYGAEIVSPVVTEVSENSIEDHHQYDQEHSGDGGNNETEKTNIDDTKFEENDSLGEEYSKEAQNFSISSDSNKDETQDGRNSFISYGYDTTKFEYAIR